MAVILFSCWKTLERIPTLVRQNDGIYRDGDLVESHDYGDCSMVLSAIAVYIC